MPETKRKSPDFFKSLNSFARQSHQTFWLASGFLTSAERKRTLMVIRLDGEFNRIAKTIDESMVAQIRLQWWRDEVERILDGKQTQQTDAALCLEGLVLHYQTDPQRITDLIDAYDDLISGDRPEYGAIVFRLLMNDESDQGRLCAASLGRYFQTANAGAPDVASLETLKRLLATRNDAWWPWLCLLEFATDWRSKQTVGSFVRRWRYWKAFLGGEKRLLSKLNRL